MRKVIIFGTEKRADEAYEILQHLQEYEVVFFSDNDSRKWGSEKYELKVIPPEDIRAAGRDVVVVIASVHYIAIKMQLVEKRLIPASSCLESINIIIGQLSDEERNTLYENLNREFMFCSLDYKERDVKETDDGLEKYLVVCNGGYPKERNARGAFVHRRVLEYRKRGMRVEAFGYVEGSTWDVYQYEGIKVFEGGMVELQKLLKARNYRKILIHFADAFLMYAIYMAGKIDMPMIVWCHGYEVMRWSREYFCYTDEEIRENREKWDLWDNKKKIFLKNIFGKDNMEFIFVSNWLKDMVRKYVGILPRHYDVIHNFIDCGYYWDGGKDAEDRFRVLSIKSHMTKTYSNDLTARCILELSKKSFFLELTFDLYGFGELFEENFGELIKCGFPNVHIYNRVISQEEMKNLFSSHGVLLSPTRMDTQGVTSCEGMGAGLAVISCNTCAVPEFIDEGCGSLYEFDNYIQLAEEVEYLYYHPEEFLAKSRNAVIRMEKQCGYGNTIRREIEIILK